MNTNIPNPWQQTVASNEQITGWGAPNEQITGWGAPNEPAFKAIGFDADQTQVRPAPRKRGFWAKIREFFTRLFGGRRQNPAIAEHTDPRSLGAGPHHG